MQKLILLLGFSLFLLSFREVGDNDDIIKALKGGKATEITKYFDSFIDLSLPGKAETKNIGKNQASIAYKSFYEENTITNFTLTSLRESAITMYIAGKLTGGGKPYSITLLLRINSGKYQIISVRIN